jgi:hypothetical protein
MVGAEAVGDARIDAQIVLRPGRGAKRENPLYRKYQCPEMDNVTPPSSTPTDGVCAQR